MAISVGLKLDANLKWMFTELPFAQRFEAAAAAGFEAVEFASPLEFDSALVRKLLDDAGLRQVLVNSPAGALGHPTVYGSACIPSLVREFRSGMLYAIQYAVELGASAIHLMAGICPADVPRDYAFATYVSNVIWSAEQVANSDVSLVLEAINKRDAPGFILDSIEQAARVVEVVNSPRVGLLFDVYHCQMSQGNLISRLQELIPLTRHIQIADVPGRAEPGTGEIAWENVLGEIRTLEYDGWIGCEYRPQAATLSGLGWREQFLRAG